MGTALPFGLKLKAPARPGLRGLFLPRTLRPMFQRFLFPLLLAALAYAELADVEDECSGNETCSLSLRQLRGSADGSKTKTKRVYRLDVTCRRRLYFLKRNALCAPMFNSAAALVTGGEATSSLELGDWEMAEDVEVEENNATHGPYTFYVAAPVTGEGSQDDQDGPATLGANVKLHRKNRAVM